MQVNNPNHGGVELAEHQEWLNAEDVDMNVPTPPLSPYHLRQRGLDGIKRHCAYMAAYTAMQLDVGPHCSRPYVPAGQSFYHNLGYVSTWAFDNSYLGLASELPVWGKYVYVLYVCDAMILCLP